MLSRRSFLAAGSLAVLFSFEGRKSAARAAVQSPADLPTDLVRNPELEAWLAIGSNGVVTLKTGKVELGQGVLTAFLQICADELCVDTKRVKIISGDTDQCPREGDTAGSFSVANGGLSVRLAAAEARALLLSRAEILLGEPSAKLEVRDGTIRVKGRRRSITYWKLVTDQALSKHLTGAAVVKAKEDRLYIGKSLKRIDLPPKIMGQPIFVQDYRPPNMVHGRIVRPPSYGAKLEDVDVTVVSNLPGIVKVVRDGSFLGVVAEHEWIAIKASRSLAQSAKWTETAQLPVDHFAWLRNQQADVSVIADEPAKMAGSRRLQATFSREFVMHGAIGPSCAVADYAAGRMTVYTHSQSVFDTAEAIAKLLKLPSKAVRAIHVQGSGCYGHNGADDAAAEAAFLAFHVQDRPVRVQWMRAEEHQWEPYGPAMVADIGVSLGERGELCDWTYDMFSTSHGTRPRGDPGNLLAGQNLEKPFIQPPTVDYGGPFFAAARNAIPLYTTSGRKVTKHFVMPMPVRVSSLRSLGSHFHIFAIESLIDEAAHELGRDPVDYRIEHLADPRAKAVIRRAADRFKWSDWKPRAGAGRGIAFGRYKNLEAYCAICVEIELDPTTREVKIVRAALAADAGEIVNPDGLRHQLEGGLIQTLSWSLLEEVKFQNSRISSNSWATYPIIRFPSLPTIETDLLDRPGEPFLGAGEAAQGPGGAAVANAIFDACQTRLRQLPMTPERIKAALAAAGGTSEKSAST